MEATFSIKGQFIDIEARAIFPAEVHVEDKKIRFIRRSESAPEIYLLPGFIDAHVHIESSMLVPSEFARLAVVHGTVATVSDPHEIANVCGKEGVEFMIEDGKSVNFNFFFGAPSCVPATPFETAGAELDEQDIEALLKRPEIHYLAEMMNWPGVVQKDKSVMRKIQLAQKYGKPIDGHAPGLRGREAEQYVSAGISTDHECFEFDEALEKINLGMKIAIREGSAAKNFDELINLMDQHADKLMFCSDDKHPDSLEEGHINQLVARAVAKGKDLYDVLKAACLNPVLHYQLGVGQLREGDPADFIVVENLKDFKVDKTFIKGSLVAEKGNSLINKAKSRVINKFGTSPIEATDLRLKSTGNQARIIMALDRQLMTEMGVFNIISKNAWAMCDPDNDILKIAVINRYFKQKPSVAFIKNFGIKNGAIASSVAHDSHNIITVGSDDEAMAKAVNLIIANKGGLSVVSTTDEKVLPLPVGGIMSDGDGYEIARKYTILDKMAKKMGSTLQSPFMTLSFMALLVIPEIKLSDKGLFDGKKFKFVDVFIKKI